MNPPTVIRSTPAITVDRCPGTGLTKPECHCPTCLAALVATHHRPAARA